MTRTQVAIADILVASKMDLATATDEAAFDAWAAQLFPRKQHVHKVASGAIPCALLDLPFDAVRSPLLAAAASGSRSFRVGAAAAAEGAAPPPAPQDTEPEESVAEPRRPVRKEMRMDETHTAAGWLFHASDVFDRKRLLAVLNLLLAQPDARRCKVREAGLHL